MMPESPGRHGSHSASKAQEKPWQGQRVLQRRAQQSLHQQPGSAQLRHQQPGVQSHAYTHLKAFWGSVELHRLWKGLCH